MVPRTANIEMKSCGKLPVVKNDGNPSREGYGLGLNFIAQGPVPERPISANPGLRLCSPFWIYLPMHCLEKHFV